MDTYYRRTKIDPPETQNLEEHLSCDVCVIGGGLAGLATAIGLAQRGKTVTVLESQMIGYGASGRNGGFVLAGYAASAKDIIKKVGLSDAQQLYNLTKDAQALIRKRAKSLDITCDIVDGHLKTSMYDDASDLKSGAEFLEKNFGEKIEFWSREKTREACKTESYYDSIFFPEYFHMHPLNYALGIAREIINLGGKIFENTAALRTDTVANGQTKVTTAKGSVTADHIVYCGSAYFNALNKKIARSCLPISTYVMVTEPLTDEQRADSVVAPYAIRDNRFTDDYYRVLPDNSLLWGGRVGLNTAPSEDELKTMMMQDLLKIYPQLKGLKAKMAWSGLMGYSVHKMPHIGKLREGVWYCTNFGGNGVGPTTAGGEVIAKAIAESDETYKLFKPFGFQYTAGPFGPLIGQTVYYSWVAADKFNLWRDGKKQKKAA